MAGDSTLADKAPESNKSDVEKVASTASSTEPSPTDVNVPPGIGPSVEKPIAEKPIVEKKVVASVYEGFVSVGSGINGGPHVREFRAKAQLTEVSSFFAYDQGFLGGVHTASWSNKSGVRYLAVAPAAGGGPQVQLFRDGTRVLNFFAYDPALRSGVYVALADFNNDGVPDIVTGPGAGGGPHVRVFSGKDASVLADYFEFDNPNLRTGVRVAAGDFNGDGVPDVAAAPGNGGGPHVVVRSGADFSHVLASFFAYETSFQSGVHLGAGRFEANGKADFLVTGAGNSDDDNVTLSANATGGGPRVRVFDLRNGTPVSVADFFAYDPAFRGGVRVATTDLDNDGNADIVTCAGIGGAPHLNVFKGASNQVLSSQFAFDPNLRGGCFVGGMAYQK